nr:ThuA domain-containing protein [uncultured Sphaerochaeta sp.]
MPNTVRKAAILSGGWAGHEPELVSVRCKKFLEDNNFEVEIYHTLDILSDRNRLMELDLFVPIWTMGELPKESVDPIIEAIGSGVGLAGCHGGMCDAFRTNVAWQFMTGGNWVAHPGGDGVPFKVNIHNSSSDLVKNIEDFEVSTEQYYLHVDPAVEVLATTEFPTVHWYHSTNGVVRVPVIWTKKWGHGRVFYNALGHHNDVFDVPQAWELMKRGMLWAADGKQEAQRKGLSIDEFKTDRKMF